MKVLRRSEAGEAAAEAALEEGAVDGREIAVDVATQDVALDAVAEEALLMTAADVAGTIRKARPGGNPGFTLTRQSRNQTPAGGKILVVLSKDFTGKRLISP